MNYEKSDICRFKANFSINFMLNEGLLIDFSMNKTMDFKKRPYK